MTRKINTVNFIIRKDKLKEEQDGVLLFKSQIRSNMNLVMFPKKCIYNFEKIITWFPEWNGRKKYKAFKFDIPLWLYKRCQSDYSRLGDYALITNNNKL